MERERFRDRAEAGRLLADAIASGGLIVLNPEALEALPISEADIHRAAAAELRELERREEAYRGGHDPPDVAGKTVILIDDGLATDATMRAAALAVRQLQPARVHGTSTSVHGTLRASRSLIACSRRSRARWSQARRASKSARSRTLTGKAGCAEALAVARAEPVLSSATALRRFAPEQARAL